MASRGTQEQRIANIGDKVAYHEKHIGRLRKEREAILNPPARPQDQYEGRYGWQIHLSSASAA